MTKNLLILKLPDEIIYRIFYFLSAKDLKKMKHVHPHLYDLTMSRMVLNNIPIQMVCYLSKMQIRKYMQYGNDILLEDAKFTKKDGKIILFQKTFTNNIDFKLITRSLMDKGNVSAQLFTFFYYDDVVDKYENVKRIAKYGVYPFKQLCEKTFQKQSIKNPIISDHEYLIVFTWVYQVLMALEATKDKHIIFCIFLFQWVMHKFQKTIQQKHLQLIAISCMQIMAQVYKEDLNLTNFNTQNMRFYCDNCFTEENVKFSYALIFSMQPPLNVDLDDNFGTTEKPLYVKHIPKDNQKLHILTANYVRKGEIIFKEPLPKCNEIEECINIDFN